MQTKQYFTMFLISVVVMMFGPQAIEIAWAGLSGPGADWDGTNEGNPSGTDNVSAGDDNIRNLKVAIRRRAETEIDWGQGLSAGGTLDTDTGRLRTGAARAFYRLVEPNQIDAADFDGSASLDSGRLWLDPNGTAGTKNRLSVHDGTNWRPVNTDGSVPVGGIIIWDSVTDPNCPDGWSREGAFDGLTIRGADVGTETAELDDPNSVPEAAGQVCGASTRGAGCDSPVGAKSYTDRLDDPNLLASHLHGIGDQGASAGSFTSDNVNRNYSTPSDETFPTTSTGGDRPHLHPFRTVVFCRKDA
jgi:hypothetical protein